jgi:hypothetical protein
MDRALGILIAMLIAAFVAELLWVPFDVLLPGELPRGLGYAIVFSPPVIHGPGDVVVRWEQVAVEMLVTTFVAGIWYLFVRHILEDSRTR